MTALEQGSWSEPCNSRECWDDVRCKEYCDVAMYYPKEYFINRRIMDRVHFGKTDDTQLGGEFHRNLSKYLGSILD